MKVWLCVAGTRYEGESVHHVCAEEKTARRWIEKTFDLQKEKAESFRAREYEYGEWPDPEWDEEGFSFGMGFDYWWIEEREVMEPHERFAIEHGQLVKE